MQGSYGYRPKQATLFKRVLLYSVVKVIPQKLNLPMKCFEIFPESSLLSTVSKKQ